MKRLLAIPFAWLWAGVGAWSAIALFTRWPMEGHASLGGDLTGRAAAALLSEPGVLYPTLLLTAAVAAWISFAKGAENLKVGSLVRVLICVWILPPAVPLLMVSVAFGPMIAMGLSPPLLMALVASAGFAVTAILAKWTTKSGPRVGFESSS